MKYSVHLAGSYTKIQNKDTTIMYLTRKEVNFTMKTKLSFLLAVIMLSSIFLTSCSQADTQTSSGQSQADEVVDVSMAIWNLTQADGNEIGERVEAKIRDDFGIQIQAVSVTMADYRDKINSLAASDDLPDIFVGDGWDNKIEFSRLVDQGLIRSIPEELYSKYENVNAMMSKYLYEAMPDGEMYHIPRDDRVNTTVNGNPIGFFYRKDWAENLGYTNLDEPMTIDEFTEFLTAMAKDDPDGNGIDDTYGLSNGMDSGLGFFRDLVYPMFGYRPWVYTDGAWEYGYSSQAAKDATAWLNQLVVDGVLDPEFVLTDETLLREKMSTDKIAVMPYNMNRGNAKLFREQYFEKINPDKEVEDYIGFLPLPTMNDGSRNSSPKSYWSVTYVSSKVDDAKLDKILAFYDWMLSEDGYRYGAWGEEGVDYEVVDGVYTTLLKDPNDAPISFQLAGTFMLLPNVASWHLDGLSDAIDPTRKQWDDDADVHLRETYWEYNYPADFTKFLLTPVLSEFNADLFSQQKLTEIIMKTTDIDADWDAFVEILYNEHNLEAVTKEVNDVAAEQGIEWVDYK